MSEKRSKLEKRGLLERGARFGRDFNIFVGSVALAGALVVPPAAVPLAAYAGLNYAQAGGFEIMRRLGKKRQKKLDNLKK